MCVLFFGPPLRPLRLIMAVSGFVLTDGNAMIISAPFTQRTMTSCRFLWNDLLIILASSIWMFGTPSIYQYLLGIGPE
jgi:hypothetical protein